MTVLQIGGIILIVISVVIFGLVYLKREEDSPMLAIGNVLGIVFLVYGVYILTVGGDLKPSEQLEQQIDKILDVEGSTMVDEVSKNKFEVIVEGKVYEVYKVDERIENITDKYTGEKMYPN